jgi:hypothetical protein
MMKINRRFYCLIAGGPRELQRKLYMKPRRARLEIVRCGALCSSQRHELHQGTLFSNISLTLHHELYIYILQLTIKSTKTN